MPYIGQEPVAGNFVLLDAITTSATATYALTKNSVAYSPESSRNMIVSLNGVTQAPETAYTVSGSNITFSSALTASDVIDYILVLGDVLDIGRPSDGVVGTDQMNYPLGNFSSTGIDDNATSTAITIDSSENVGIGTTSPSTALHIDTGTTNDAIRLVSTDADVNILMGDNTGSVRLQNSGGDFVAYTGTSAFGGFVETMRIDSSGNVITGSATANASDAVTLRQDGTAHVNNAQFSNGNGSVGGTTPSIYSPASASLAISTNSAERMRIDGSGNVGIGTSSNIAGINLEIKKAGAYLGLNSTSAGYSLVRGYDNGTERWSIGQIGFGGADGMAFYTGSSNTERMRIDSSGNLLVGQTSAYTGTGTTITGDGGISNATASGVASSLNLAGIIGVSNGFQITTNTSNQHEYTFLNGGSVAAKIDTSGRVFIGKTSDNDNTAGHTLHSSGLVVHTRNQSRAAIFNRTTDDGEIIQFKKDGTSVGSIGSTSGVVSHIILDPRSGVKGAGLLGSSADANTGILQPTDSSGATADGAIVLGTSSNRFKDLYLSGGAYLGGTGAANHLDDYEEGTFTPTLSGGGTAGTTTYSIQSGKYTKIGRMVHVILNISYTSATGTGSYNIGGLPFTSANIDQNYAVGSILPSGVNWTGGTSLVALQFQNTNYIVPYYMSDDGSADSQQMVNESANFRLSLTYYTS